MLKYSSFQLGAIDISGKCLYSFILHPDLTPLPPSLLGKGGFKASQGWGRGTLRENAPRSWRGVFFLFRRCLIQTKPHPFPSPKYRRGGARDGRGEVQCVFHSTEIPYINPSTPFPAEDYLLKNRRDKAARRARRFSPL